MTHPRLSLWPGLPLDVHVRRPAHPLPYPLGDPGCRVFAWARHGLWHGVRSLRLDEGDEVLVPAYHHGSEVEALRRAHLRPVFFDLGSSLEPDPDDLASLVTERTRALHLIHYYGFPQDAAAWRAWCDERELLLIEDVAQSWMATSGEAPLGAVGDLAIFCPYKSFGLPHVGLARAGRWSLTARRGTARDGSEIVRLHGKWSMGRWGAVAAIAEPLEESLRRPVEDDQALGAPDERPPRGVGYLLRRVVDPRAAERRRANYRFLLEELRDLVPAPFDALPPGAVPLVFPIRPANVDGLLAALERERILARPFWPEPHPSLPVQRFPVAASLRERLVTLPVHQELRTRDLEHIADAVRRTSPGVRVSVRGGAGEAGPPDRPVPAGRTMSRRPPVEFYEDLEALRDPWTELAARNRNVFGTWEWTATWWRHFGPSARLCLALCRDPSGRPVAILPLYRSRWAGLRLLRFIGHGPGDEIGPVCAEETRQTAPELLADAIRKLPLGWDLLIAEQLPADASWNGALRVRTLRTEGSPRIRLGERTWDEFLGGLGRKLRHEIRHDERKMGREHDLRFRMTSSGTLDNDLDLLFSLHGSVWPSSEFEVHRAFHSDFARLAMDRGWLRLWFLELDGAPAAVWYGFRYADVDAYYQGGRDPAWLRSSVGTVLMAHTIRDSCVSEVSEYRFLRGGEAYKYRFANEDPGLVTFAVPSGVPGRAALALASLAGRASLRAVRRRLG